MKPQIEPRKQPRQQRSQVMVNAILDATARVLVDAGYAKANTNAIAEAAGISVGSLYQYFPNKDALVAALHRRHIVEMHQTFARIAGDPAPRTLQQAIAALIHAAVDAHRVEPRLHKVLEEEVPHLDRFEGSEDQDRQIEEVMDALMRTHRDEIKARDLKLASFIVSEIVHTLIHAAVINPPAGIDDVAVEREAVHAVLGYLTFSSSPQAILP